MKIRVDSVEYRCWHEVGHVAVCLHLGGDVDFIELLEGDARCGFSYLMSASVQALSDQLRCPRVTFPENHSATYRSNQADS
jgi:hypothetical protein